MIHVKHLQRRWFFAALDLTGIVGAFYASLWIRANVPLPIFKALLRIDVGDTFVAFFIPMGIAALVYVFFQYALGVYDHWATSSSLTWGHRLALPNTLLVATLFTFLYLAGVFDFPGSLLVIMGICNAIWGVLWRRVYFHGVEKKKSSIVLVGKLAACLRLAKEFDHPPFESRVIVDAIFTSDENFVSDAATSEKPVFALTSFQAYAKENPFTSVIVIPADLGYDSTFSEVLSAAKKGVTVYAMPSAYEILMGRMRHIQVNDLPLLELKLEPPSAFFSFLKRVFDVVFALVLFVLLSPLLLAVAFIVKITSKGPVIYAQERVGFRGKIFRVLKFRSMVSDAEKMSGPVFATKSDSRVTPFGRFMRKTRIDELPQLLNILEGDMSFVGPRPERPVFVNRFEKEIPGYRERKRIRPGVTGLAQVSGNYESSAEVKIKYDLAYMANQSLTLDFQILLRTAKAVFMRAGQ